MQEYISITEVAEMLGMNRYTVWWAMKRGQIKSVRMGRKWLTKRAWVEDYLQRPQDTE